MDAAGTYDHAHLHDGRTCRFRTFLWLVLRARICSYLRRRTRAERRLDRSVTPDGCLGTEADPAEVAEVAELCARLREWAARLTPGDCALYEHLLAGSTLRQAAAALGLSYPVTKRRWWRLRARLLAWLGQDNVP